MQTCVLGKPSTLTERTCVNMADLLSMLYIFKYQPNNMLCWIKRTLSWKHTSVMMFLYFKMLRVMSVLVGNAKLKPWHPEQRVVTTFREKLENIWFKETVALSTSVISPNLKMEQRKRDKESSRRLWNMYASS